MKYLITGMAGSGKTTITETLARNENSVGIDLDKTNLCCWINKETGEKADYCEGAGSVWIENHGWRLNVQGLKRFLKFFPEDRNVYIGGKIATSQLEEVRRLFDEIFLLKPSDRILSHRQTTRKNKQNKFAKSEDEQKLLLNGRKKFEDACLAVGAILIDADKTVEEVAAEIDRHPNN